MYKYVGKMFSSNTQNVFRNNNPHLSFNAMEAIFGIKLQIKQKVSYLSSEFFIKMFDKMI